MSRISALPPLMFWWVSRSLWLVYHLLHDDAEKYVQWPPSTTCGLIEPQITDVEGVLDDLQQTNRWPEAREWGECTGVDTQEVVLYPCMPFPCPGKSFWALHHAIHTIEQSHWQGANSWRLPPYPV